MAYYAFRGKIALIFFMIVSLMILQFPVMAAPESFSPSTSDEQLMELMEKSLSIVEIDKEITRIQDQKASLEQDMKLKNKQLGEQELLIADKREAAGKVLRAYYMGERDLLIRALLTFRSLQSWLTSLDYIEIIFSQDKLAIDSYLDGVRRLKDEYAAMDARKTELNTMETRLQTQRDRVLALEKQIDGELAGRSDADRLRLLMSELTDYWETAGVEEVENYFRALSKAMQKLPGWVQDNKNYLEIKGFNYTLRVPQDALNAFLREQDKRFEHFSFTFTEGKITAQGNKDGMEISVTGHYTVEDEPQNGIIFHVDELLFNGFALPDTTRRSLEDKFDLGFYPGLIISFLKATAVDITDGELVVKLKVAL
ncbi:coiled-coil domain-containing protein [Paenibacillus sp. NPDC058174]|uniref:coiled-coil domain-containing protein n=1 Tax=Paenibacillus sp. NPDC058174 TaxID=3346366 RepID=UPI0036DF5108